MVRLMQNAMLMCLTYVDLDRPRIVHELLLESEVVGGALYSKEEQRLCRYKIVGLSRSSIVHDQRSARFGICSKIVNQLRSLKCLLEGEHIDMP